MGLCFENADKEIITGNVIIFCGRECVGLFIYIQYQFLYKNPLFRSSGALSCFAHGSDRLQCIIGLKRWRRCYVRVAILPPSAVAIVLPKHLAPTLQKH